MSEQPPAGWYPDPAARYERRYWDGGQWTDHVATRGQQGIDTTRDHALRAAGTLFTEEVLIVNQKARLIGSTASYAIFGQTGQRLGTVQEIRRGLTKTLSDRRRGRTESNRAHRFQVSDLNGRVLLAMTRPETGWFAMKGKLVVEGPESTPIGQIVYESSGVGGSLATLAHAGITNASAIAQFGLGGVKGLLAGGALEGVQPRLSSAVEGLDKIGHARFGIEAGGQRLGSINAEDTRQWDFHVQDARGTEIARITKTWAGWAKERFTRADNYVVKMHRPLEEPLRSLVIAAALAIDTELRQRGDATHRHSTWSGRA